MTNIHIRSVFINDMRTKEKPSAKEMFGELGFRQILDNERELEYRDIYNNDFYVNFDKKYKAINCFQNYDFNFDIKLLKAINKQIEELEELGWNK